MSMLEGNPTRLIEFLSCRYSPGQRFCIVFATRRESGSFRAVVLIAHWFWKP